MKKVFTAFLILSICSISFANGKKDSVNITYGRKFKTSYSQKMPKGEPVEFNEVWGWVMQGRENELDCKTPVTDVGYFAAEVNCYGQLETIPVRSNLKKFKGRVHLVLVCDSRSLTHLVLDPQFGIIDKMISDIMEASKKFDGVQVDYELIPLKDSENFIKFLERLSTECKRAGKIFSVCVPAKIKNISNDIFPYKKISEISDRVAIMAYDEHWSTSKPGPIASLSWCEKVASYATKTIPKEKLIMGLPFYGRSWANEKPAQGWYFSGVNRIIKTYNSKKVQYNEGVPHVKIKMSVDVDCWFEDTYSTVEKMRLYQDKGVKNIAFWRIGQEDPRVWNWITLTK